MVARNGRFLSRGESVMVSYLVAGRTYEEAAEAAGMSVRTISRRMADERFQALVREERDAVVAAVRDRLTAASLDAVARLVWLLHDCHSNVELGAARTILEMGRKYREDEHRQEHEKSDPYIIFVSSSWSPGCDADAQPLEAHPQVEAVHDLARHPMSFPASVQRARR
jgi:hypothetical protein